MTYYDVLNVPCDATEEEIKAAYRNMLKAFHPDYYTGDKAFAENMTQRIVEAYSVLKNPEQRRRYDDTISINKGSSKSGFESASDNTKANDTESPENPPQPSERTRRIRPSVVLSLFVLAVSIYAALSLGGQFKSPSVNDSDPVVYFPNNATFYHLKGCPQLAKKHNKASLSEATRAGLKPCGRCKPPVIEDVATEEVQENETTEQSVEANYSGASVNVQSPSKEVIKEPFRNISVTTECDVIYNDHVGDDIYYNVTINGEDVTEGRSISILIGKKNIIIVSCWEDDSDPDYAEETMTYTFTEAGADGGLSLKIPVTIEETSGQYAGNQALCEVSIEFAP